LLDGAPQRDDADPMIERIRLDRDAVAVLRSPTRQHILNAAQRPLTARQIAAALGIPITRVYHHVERLTRAGLLTVVGSEKDGTSVSQVYRARIPDLWARADFDQVGAMLQDSLADAGSAGPGHRTLVGKIVGPLPEAAVDRLIAAIGQVIEEFDAATDTDPDGELVGFTYVVAPVRTAGNPYRIRRGTADDLPVYRRILYEAVAWDPNRALPPLDQIVEHPQLALFHRGWGRPGDLAVVAHRAGEPIGGAFGRLFTEEEHGSGYVDPDTPEIAIAVWPGHRGRGLGTRLLAALAEAARAAGIGRLSLAVERENPAADLYLRCGYRIIAEPGADYLMVLDL
jgi:GNAT superfamily N-acetyltransferase/DNA-binding transcriptional ArsR family regulator